MHRRGQRLAVALGAVAAAAAVAVPALASPGPEGVPIPNGLELAPPADTASIGPVDGIKCQPREQVLYHIHAHLTVFVDGHARQIPAGIGIADPQAQATPDGPFVVAGVCFSWLHTHAADGIIHIESPTQRTYTLGDFFDLWGQPLGGGRVSSARGSITAYVNGKVWSGSPRSIPLKRHAQIQLDVGRPLVAPVKITSWNGL